MTRAAKACPSPDCPNVQPCPIHAKQPWAGSQRRDHLRKRSGFRQQRLRRFVLHRDNNICHRCGNIFDERDLVNDHVIPLSQGGPDYVDNMAPCCTSCHQAKTQREARAGRT